MIYSRFKWNENSFLELSRPKSAFIYFRTTRLNLITGFPETYRLELFLKRLEGIELQGKMKTPTVFHFYYDLGLILMGLGHTVDENTPLAIEIEYEDKKFKKSPKSRLKSIPLKSLERPSWSEYKSAFNHIQEHLLNGNCYQVNLTYPYDFETEEVIDPRDIADFFFAQKGLGAYAHLTFLGDEMILSNSPECLFQYQNNKMYTMPIKGTMKRGKDWKKDWEKMKADVKEEGELNMITDLLRNDLNRLDKPEARVIKKRSPLLVPNLLHQHSVLSVELTQKISLLKTLESLFPGGSVTGAPKKRVMEIIQEVERYSRGIYCGSTLLCLNDKKIASINIRTAQLSIMDRLWRYGAGGGVTLLSRAPAEYQEMEEKVASFLTLLAAPGYKA
ncbi:chorismate-binding protein [Peredibacter starrii]|uniref:Chorismate-binding protein n=1 Tax=Peredibacter starrii TaxID=28202 RepID=A0AAX4HMK3_9BACT|nr:chorismate-binding protein [Peredibacter starrii]WPU64425.1 chorismate-binding protein [Peredibacter starrii]